jgi:hypothetical protein
MSKYCTAEQIKDMNEARKQIFAIRTAMFKNYEVDLLDTDAMSALAIRDIVTQYDPNYEINFARNGEDAKSGEVLIEQKTNSVKHPVGKSGKLRRTGGRDADFMFHAMGDIKHTRYIFVARLKTDFTLLRLYDIAAPENTSKIYNELLRMKNEWLNSIQTDAKFAKFDGIYLKEEFILDNIPFYHNIMVDTCKVFKDFE